MCHRRMQLCAGETRARTRLALRCLSAAFCALPRLHDYGWTLSASCKSELWKAGRVVGTTCACASAYGRRDAPSPVGLCLLCLDLSMSCVRDACRLRARVFHAQHRSRHFAILSQPARTLYDTKCVAALLIRPRKVTQIYIYIQRLQRDGCAFRRTCACALALIIIYTPKQVQEDG